jgi:hypothetical protein
LAHFPPLDPIPRFLQMRRRLMARWISFIPASVLLLVSIGDMG